MKRSAFSLQLSARKRKLVLGLAFASTVALGLSAQVVVEEIGALQDAFSKAQASFQAYKFSDALNQLGPILDTLTKWEKSGRLQAADEALL